MRVVTTIPWSPPARPLDMEPFVLRPARVLIPAGVAPAPSSFFLGSFDLVGALVLVFFLESLVLFLGALVLFLGALVLCFGCLVEWLGDLVELLRDLVESCILLPTVAMELEAFPRTVFLTN